MVLVIISMYFAGQPVSPLVGVGRTSLVDSSIHRMKEDFPHLYNAACVADKIYIHWVHPHTFSPVLCQTFSEFLILVVGKLKFRSRIIF